MEPSPTFTWLLLVEPKFQKNGNRFPVNTTSDDKIADIVEKVREEKPKVLSRAHIDPSDLTVWRIKGVSIINHLTTKRSAEILSRIDVNDQDMIEEVDEDKRVSDLGLSDGETLLLQLPGTSCMSSTVGYVLKEETLL